MSYPNTLIFVDFPSSDPEASAEFYRAVFGWEVEPRPKDEFYRIVPGQNFKVDDGSQGPTGNLHMGIFNTANTRPHPIPEGVDPRLPSQEGATSRVWILVSPDDTTERMLAEAGTRGAEILWTKHYWAEFNGFNAAFRDPWGNTFVLWTQGGDDPEIPEGWTNE